MSLTEMTVSGGALVLVILAVRSLALHRLPKRTFLVLWEVAAARLLLPVELRIPLPLPARPPIAGDPGAAAAAWTAEQALGQAAGFGPGEALPPAAPGGLDWAAALPVIWFLGAAALGGYFLWLYGRSMGRFRSSLPVSTPFLRDWLAGQRLRRPLEVRQSDRIAAPLTYGILRPVILLPKGMEAREEGILVRVLTHELVHVRRFDGAAKLAFAAALCVHWFNPLVWVLYVLANRDLELSCDERVIRILGGEERAAYALTLIGLEEDRGSGLSFCSHFSRLAIEERIEAIMKYKKKSLPAAALAAALILGSATASFASAREAGQEPGKDPGTAPGKAPASDVDSGVGVLQGEVLARGGKGGEKSYSVDGGKTWLSEERYQAQYGAWGEDWQVEWWAAEEYEKWLEQEKKELQEIIGSQGWTPSTGWFTWDQKKVDEAVAQYEEILEEIKAGVLHSKRVLDKNGQEVPDVALGAGTALATTVIASFDKSTADTPEAPDPAELLKALEKYGVTGSEKEGLAYKGQPVRTLADGAAVEGGWSVQYVYRNDKGTVDLHTLRARRDNGDGSYDPMGALTGVAAKGDPGFDQGFIDSCSLTGAVTAVTEETGTAEPQDGPAGGGRQAPIQAEAAAADGSGAEEGTPLPEMFDKYKPFGLEYRETRTADGVRRNLFYQGKPVNYLEDVYDGGVFSFGSSDQSPEGLYVWTCYNTEGELSKLTTLASVVLSEEEAAEPIERDTLVNGDFPRNSKGETYGNGNMSRVLGRKPDLIAAMGTEGQSGYIRKSDQEPPDFMTPEEAVAWQLSQPQGPHNIPLYDFQGNEIGEFEVSGSRQLPKGISMEEAKRIIAAGGSGE